MKHLVLTRIPPGDKWKDPKDKEVMDTLTDAINHVFMRTGDKQFYIDYHLLKKTIDTMKEYDNPEKDPA